MSERTISDLAAHCIRCGFCLESCPTFALTGQETESPRGRIYLIRNADAGKMDWDREVAPHLAKCLGCRACETACPSGVEYGALLELAREKNKRPWAERFLLSGLTKPGVLRLPLAAAGGRKMPAAVARFLTDDAPQAEVPRPQGASGWPRLDLTMSRFAYLLEGCAMGVLFPRVHEATRRLMLRCGFGVLPSQAGCCGALHAHAGDLDSARAMALALADAMPGDAPIVVNSAGCGSAMKAYADLGDDPRLRDVAARVVDISEFLLAHGLESLLAGSQGLPGRATYHDACHLAHGQRVRSEPRALLTAIPGLSWVPLPESEMCCGSAGTYNVLQPAMARRLLDRKWANIEATGVSYVALGNPGCHAWIAQAAREKGGHVRVLHTAELLESSFSGLPVA